MNKIRKGPSGRSILGVMDFRPGKPLELKENPLIRKVLGEFREDPGKVWSWAPAWCH